MKGGFRVWKPIKHMRPIAHIHNGFETKFGVPRQSGIINEAMSEIVFEKEYSVREAFRGLEDFSHIWVIWEFSEAEREGFSPTVRPPRLGGNKRMGVFATRSPFRPNPLGLSVLKLDEIVYDKARGTILRVRGADMKNGTPIYDIKPYLPEFDSISQARGGFAEATTHHRVDVTLPQELCDTLDAKDIEIIRAILEHDPKPSYRHDDRIYGMRYAGYEVKFYYNDDGIVVTDISACE